MHVFGVGLLALGVLGLLFMALDLAVTEARSLRRERVIDERLADRRRWR